MPKKYYKYDDIDNPLGGAVRFIETEHGYVLRELSVSGRLIIGSNIRYPKWGLMLSEGQVPYDDIEQVTPIDAAAFVSLWGEHLDNNAARWAVTKAAYPIGRNVQGTIAVFYPQGVIVDLNDSGALGVADDSACRASAGLSAVGTGDRVTARVSGYDEESQWVALDQPEVQVRRSDRSFPRFR